MIKPLKHKRVKKGADDCVILIIEDEHVSNMGIVTKYPENLEGWKFWMYIHKHVDYCPENEVCKTVGYVPEPEKGYVKFVTCGCKIDVPPGMYFYTVMYETPNGRRHLTKSAKYEILQSINDYFSIYK